MRPETAAMSPTSAASRSKRAACLRFWSKVWRLRRNVATGPAKVERICTSPSLKPPGLSAAPRRPISSPSATSGTSTTDCASAMMPISWARRGSSAGELLT